MERYLIVDVEANRNALLGLQQDFNLYLLDAGPMTRRLCSLPVWKNLDPWSTLVVMPGNGASIVKTFVTSLCSGWLEKWPWKAYPCAKRHWIPGENPFAFTGRINQGVYVGIKKVLVIDDVISSGETIRGLRRKNMDFVPNAEWLALAWVMQRSAATKGYSLAAAPRYVGTKERKAPVNSLSTLVAQPEIARSYAQRNFKNEADSFLDILGKV